MLRGEAPAAIGCGGADEDRPLRREGPAHLAMGAVEGAVVVHATLAVPHALDDPHGVLGGVVLAGAVGQLVDAEQARLIVAIAVDDVPAPAAAAQPVEMRSEARDLHRVKEGGVQRGDDAEMLRRLHQRRREHDGVERGVLEAEAARLLGARRIAVADQGEVEADLLAGMGEGDVVRQVHRVRIERGDLGGWQHGLRLRPEGAEAHRRVRRPWLARGCHGGGHLSAPRDIGRDRAGRWQTGTFSRSPSHASRGMERSGPSLPGTGARRCGTPSSLGGNTYRTIN